MSSQSIAVVGGGITGLAAAYRFALEGRQVRLFEASSRLGGSVRSERLPEGWLVETGPSTVVARTQEFVASIQRLGLAPRCMTSDPRAKKRYLVRDGRLMAVPSSIFSAIGTRLFSWDLKKRIVRDFLFAKRQERETDVSLAQLAREHYGEEFVRYALNPMAAGIYAGDPGKLSARYAMPFIWDAERSHGSIVKGQIAQMRARRAAGAPKAAMISFPGGLQELTAAFAAQLPHSAIEVNARVESVNRVRAPASDEPRWQVTWSREARARDGSPTGTRFVESEVFSKVLLALPPHALARLCIAPQPLPAAGTEGFFTPLGGLAKMESPPVASLFLGYRRSQVAHKLDGFGALVPAVEKLPFLGVLFSSSLFPGRTPSGHVGLTVMIGGTRQPGLVDLPEQQLVELIAPALAKLLGVNGAPVFSRLSVHEHAIPQYNLGHEHFLKLIDEFESQHPGVRVAGNARDGIAVPACAASGEARAEAMLGIE